MRILAEVIILFIYMPLLFCYQNSNSINYVKATVIQTSKAGDKLNKKATIKLSNYTNIDIPIIEIEPDVRFQKIEGFGGAFTSSSAYLLSKLSKIKRRQILEAYFSSKGANYSLMRNQIGGSDFSVYSYSYDDMPCDTNLINFSIREDSKYIIPIIKDAQKISADGFKIIASPWTAPKWMKDNNAWYGGSLKLQYYPTWALYISKYIKAYRKEKIPIWGITPENEPLGNNAHWDSMVFTPQQMRDFIKNDLIPLFEKENLETKIFIYDQNCDEAEKWTNVILGDSINRKYISGIAIHWYSSSISWFADVLNELHKNFPTKEILHTEACIDTDIPIWNDDNWYWSKLATDWGYEWASEKDKPLHPKYKPVFRYAMDIIGNLNNWVSGWIDWNIVLNEKGGPNHANNWAIAPVIVKPETNEVYYTPLYYIMCHFSKYIRPGAYRIGVKTKIKNLMTTACLNPDGKIALEIFNPTEKSVQYEIKIVNKYLHFKIPGNSLQTVVLK